MIRLTLIRSKTTSQIARTAVFLLTIATAGCAVKKVDPQPFATYAAANREMQASSDAVLGVAYDQSLQGFLKEASRSPEQATLALQLREARGDPFGWNGPEDQVVLPWKVAAFRRGVDHLNTALVGYADLLSSLSSGETETTAQLDKLAADLNGNIKSAAAAFGREVDDSSAAILSTAAAGAMRQYIEGKRAADLGEAIRQNQGAIEDAAALGRSAARGTAAVIRQEYNRESARLARDLADGRGSIQLLIELDEHYIDNLQVLRAIDTAYRQLPVAHQQLAGSIGAKGSTFDNIHTFYQEALRLRALYQDLKGSTATDIEPANP